MINLTSDKHSYKVSPENVGILRCLFKEGYRMSVIQYKLRHLNIHRATISRIAHNKIYYSKSYDTWLKSDYARIILHGAAHAHS